MRVHPISWVGYEFQPLSREIACTFIIPKSQQRAPQKSQECRRLDLIQPVTWKAQVTLSERQRCVMVMPKDQQ